MSTIDDVFDQISNATDTLDVEIAVLQNLVSEMRKHMRQDEFDAAAANALSFAQSFSEPSDDDDDDDE